MKMSTLFVVMVPEGSYQCEVEEEDIPKGYYEAVAHRGNSGKCVGKIQLRSYYPLKQKSIRGTIQHREYSQLGILSKKSKSRKSINNQRRRA